MTPKSAVVASAREFVEKRWPTRGPCLIAKPGANVPNCHENDFCRCDMHEAYEIGHAAGLAQAKAMYTDQRHAYNEQKKWIGQERAKSAALYSLLAQYETLNGAPNYLLAIREALKKHGETK